MLQKKMARFLKWRGKVRTTLPAQRVEGKKDKQQSRGRATAYRPGARSVVQWARNGTSESRIFQKIQKLERETKYVVASGSVKKANASRRWGQG